MACEVYEINEKRYVPYISEEVLNNILNDLSLKIISHYQDKISVAEPLIIIGVLETSYMFVSDLAKKINLYCEIGFTILDKNNELQILTKNIGNKNVLLLDNLIGDESYIANIINQLKINNPKSIKVCGLLYKYQTYKGNIKIDFIGNTIANNNIIGYGLNHKGLGGNLNMIYIEI